MLSENSKETAFLVTNASGRHINILNDNEQREIIEQQQQPSPSNSELSEEINTDNFPSSTKRKYHCSEPGCPKSFTTSGHLARHNRIHTGEKNFPCLFPGCQSRFSRQDNMMQHYRTHMSPKSRRTQKKIISEDLHPRPRLHAHQRIRSDPYRVERPLTIDQHLNNYRRSLLSHPSSSISTSVKYNMPTPLGSVAASHMQKQQIALQQKNWVIEPISHQSCNSSHHEDDNEEEEQIEEISTPPEILFYQHKPLVFSSELNKSCLPFTLLHPTQTPQLIKPYQFKLQQEKEITISNTTLPNNTLSNTTLNTENTNSSSQAGLLQLAHIVSTFG